MTPGVSHVQGPSGQVKAKIDPNETKNAMMVSMVLKITAPTQ